MKTLIFLLLTICCYTYGFDFSAGDVRYPFNATISGITENGTFLWKYGNTCRTNPHAFDIIQRAFKMWEVPGTCIKFAYTGPSISTNYTGLATKQNVITFLNDPDLFGLFSNQMAGVNMCWINGKFSVLASEILLDDNCQWTDDMLMNAVLDQIGTSLCIESSLTNSSSIMYIYVTDSYLTRLGPDDIAAARYGYPSAKPYNLSVSLSGSTTGASPFTAQFTANIESGNPIDFIWDFGDGSPMDVYKGNVLRYDIAGNLLDGTQNSHTYTVAGNYTVSLITNDILGTTLRTTTTVTVTTTQCAGLMQYFKYSENNKAKKASLTAIFSTTKKITGGLQGIRVGDVQIPISKKDRVLVNRNIGLIQVYLSSSQKVYQAIKEIETVRDGTFRIPVTAEFIGFEVTAKPQ